MDYTHTRACFNRGCQAVQPSTSGRQRCTAFIRLITASEGSGSRGSFPRNSDGQLINKQCTGFSSGECGNVPGWERGCGEGPREGGGCCRMRSGSSFRHIFAVGGYIYDMSEWSFIFLSFGGTVFHAFGSCYLYVKHVYIVYTLAYIFIWTLLLSLSPYTFICKYILKHVCLCV